MQPHLSRRSGRAFTLVEILIVVVILGILAAFVVPQFTGASEEARIAAFVSSLKTYADASEIYNAREGQYPIDGSSGVVPAGFETYVDSSEWAAGTPMGGVWDSELNDSGVSAAVGVHFMGGGNPGDSVMVLVDEKFDDGDLGTGLFQKLAGDRYYYILDP
jgi:prepilin-type N-terminal cleavage/methylation domain-containing protein